MTEQEQEKERGEEEITNENYRLLSDEEREKKVIELYFFKGKKYDYIAPTMGMSFSTISDIVKKYRESKAKERETEKKEQETSVYNIGNDNGNGGNGDARSRARPTTTSIPQQILQPEHQQQQAIIPLLSSTATTIAEVKSLSDNEKAAIAYKLYDQGKRPVDVISMLLLSAEEAMEYYHKFWKLNRDYELYHAYHEMKSYLPSLLRLHNQLKRHGLTNRTHDIDYFVSVMETEAFKLPEIEAELSELQDKVEAARNELHVTQQEKRNVLYQLRNEKRIIDNDTQAAKKNLSDLKEACNQMQQTFDTLLHQVNNATYRLNSIQQFVLKLKRTNKDYVRVKEVAEDHIRSVLTEEGIMKLLSIAVNSVVEALRQNPDMCANVVFN